MQSESVCVPALNTISGSPTKHRSTNTWCAAHGGNRFASLRSSMMNGSHSIAFTPRGCVDVLPIFPCLAAVAVGCFRPRQRLLTQGAGLEDIAEPPLNLWRA